MKAQFPIVIAVLVVIAGAAPSHSQEFKNAELTQTEFEELHKKLLEVDEEWKSIPWKTSLVDAQNTAAKDKKLLFVWAMDGHPLGCT